MPRAPLIVLASVLLSASAARASEGGYLRLSWGGAYWSPDRERVARQVGARDDVAMMFDASMKDAQALSLSLGYNVLGHAHVGAQLVATGWSVTTVDRGGGGWLGGEIGWHPLELAQRFVEGGLPYRKFYDLWLETGYGYALVGKARALDGGAFLFGVAAEGYPTPWLSVGVRLAWHWTSFSRYILDYDRRDVPGNTIELPDGSGGSFFLPAIFVATHFGSATP